jgi:hypothetical protein
MCRLPGQGQQSQEIAQILNKLHKFAVDSKKLQQILTNLKQSHGISQTPNDRRTPNKGNCLAL